MKRQSFKLAVEELRWTREVTFGGKPSVEVVLRGHPNAEIRFPVPTTEQPQVGDHFFVTVEETEGLEVRP